MTNSSSTHNPFYAHIKIIDSRYFVGRKAELDFMTTKAISAQSISVNIVGEERIGKSSLLYHFFQTYEQQVSKHGANPNNYIVIYLSLKQAQAQTKIGFYQAIAEKLLYRPSVQNNPTLADPFKQPNLEQQKFRQALEVWKNEHIFPIVCLDEFENFFKDAVEFDDGFFDNLRSLVEDNLLMFVIASDKPMIEYRQKYYQISKFDNVFNSKTLQEFTETEIKDFVKLPQTNDSTQPIALDSRRQKLVKEWGQKHPYLLQLAASYLWEAQTQSRSDEWAMKEFEKNAYKVPSNFPLPSYFWRCLVWLGKMLTKLGGFAFFVGQNQENFWKGLIGMIIVVAFFVVPILFLSGAIDLEAILKFIEKVKGG